MGAGQARHITIPEYLEIEASSETKLEYERGAVLAMTGGSIDHGILCGDAYRELKEACHRNCQVFGSEIRIHVEAADAIVYPDTMVVCGQLEISASDKEAVVNPILVVEVLSSSTESYDRGDKFYKYRQLSSLKEYILIDQQQPVVETFFRKEPNVWEIARFTGLDAAVQVKCLGVQIPMEQLFFNVRR